MYLNTADSDLRSRFAEIMFEKDKKTQGLITKID